GVMTATSGKQVPWESSSLTGDFYFAAPNKVAPETSSALASGAVPATGVPTAAAVPAASQPEARTFGTWISSLFGSGKPEPDAGSKAPADAPLPSVAPTPPAAAAQSAGG